MRLSEEHFGAPGQPGAVPHAFLATSAGGGDRPLERLRSFGRAPALPPDVEFLARHGVPLSILQSAALLASSRSTKASKELFAHGFDRARYWEMLAADLQLEFIADLSAAELPNNPGILTVEAVRLAAAVLVIRDGCVFLVAAPDDEQISRLRAELRANPALAGRVAIAAPETIRSFLLARRDAPLSFYAVNRLSQVLPRLSARQLRTAEPEGPLALFGALAGLWLVAPVQTTGAIGFLLTLFFTNCAAWKLAAAFSRPRPLRLEAVPTGLLPSYTILVPLYREERIVGDLVRHLACIDYPVSKLQILLLVEADDVETAIAVACLATGPMFEVVAVPPHGPRTKPKALTFALPFARGDLVVVYDAEDRPEPDQLRRAAAAFRERPGLGCVQARLAPDNEDSALAKLFTVEYSANFQVLLPALSAWQVPVPLGGTSNHFPRAVLERVGGWDPFNVTEDADLGIRLARFGYQTATILSRTYEEAPVTFRQWLPQRRRWIKGWIQTSLVCLRRNIPGILRLPLRESLAVHGTVTAGVVGLLLYPLSLGLVLATVLSLAGGHRPVGTASKLLLALNCANMAAVLIASFVSALRGLDPAARRRLAWWIPALPLYWALMSFAAWQAVFQFATAPCRWEKTLHGVGRRRPMPTAPVAMEAFSTKRAAASRSGHAESRRGRRSS